MEENNIFDKVLENVDIVDVVSKFVDLIPKGKNFFGICPFHDDTNPSMSVSRERGIFHCFVCKEGGNAIRFVEKKQNMTSIDATRWLANEYHIDISEFNNERVDKTKKYYDLMGTSSKFYSFLMNDENFSREAREYLLNRGITNEAIKEFNIGLSSDDEKALTNTLISKNFILPDIVLNGLSNGERDIFTSRIMIPIRDEYSRTVAFGGRIYKKNSNNENKYLNSKETPIFKKGELIFNLDKAKDYIKEKNYLILNEGYMDVIQAYSKGIKNSIALMGTAMTPQQADLIKKYTSNVNICLDGDEAGIKGVKSVILRLEEKGINVSITILKEGLDPDEYLRKYGKDQYLNEIENNKMDKIGYLYELTKLDFPVINSFNMESFKKAIFSNMRFIRERSVIETYLKRLSSELKVSYDSIIQDFNNYINPYNEKIEYNEPKTQETFRIEGAYKKAMKMIIDYSLKSHKYYKEIEIDMDSRVFLKDEYLKELFIGIGDIYDDNPNISEDDLIMKLKSSGLYNDFNHDNDIDYDLKDLKNNVIKTIKKEDIKESIVYYTNKLKIDLSQEDRMRYLKKICELKKELRK